MELIRSWDHQMRAQLQSASYPFSERNYPLHRVQLNLRVGCWISDVVTHNPLLFLSDLPCPRVSPHMGESNDSRGYGNRHDYDYDRTVASVEA